MPSLAPYAKSGFSAPVVAMAFTPASTGRRPSWGANFFKSQFMGSASYHAYNPSLAIHKTIPGGFSRGVKVSATAGDLITGYRC